MLTSIEVGHLQFLLYRQVYEIYGCSVLQISSPYKYIHKYCLPVVLAMFLANSLLISSS